MIASGKRLFSSAQSAQSGKSVVHSPRFFGFPARNPGKSTADKRRCTWIRKSPLEPLFPSASISGRLSYSPASSRKIAITPYDNRHAQNLSSVTLSIYKGLRQQKSTRVTHLQLSAYSPATFSSFTGVPSLQSPMNRSCGVLPRAYWRLTPRNAASVRPSNSFHVPK